MRTLSNAIKNVLAQNYAETKDVVTIIIPAQFGATNYPETTLYFANGEGIFIDGIQYENKLRNISAIKFSLSKAPDNCSFVIENVSRSLGFAITDFQRALDGSKIVIKRAFRTTDIDWETDIMFVGYINDTKVDQNNIEVTAVSDMNRRGTAVANEPLTQRCILRFNVNGSGVGPICGWMTSQPGNPLSCDKGVDTPNGCQSHGNQHRFGGVPQFTDITVSNGYDPTGGGWGDASGGGWCIAQSSFVLVEKEGKKLWVRAYELKVGDNLISIDSEGNFVPTKLVRTKLGTTKQLHTLITRQGYKISCTGEHGVMQKYTSATAEEVKNLEVGNKVLVYDFHKHSHFKDEIEYKIVNNREALIVSLQLETPYHLFMASDNEKGAIVSHNVKPIYTNYGDGGYPVNFYDAQY